MFTSSLICELILNQKKVNEKTWQDAFEVF